MKTLVDWMFEHPYLATFGWCWAASAIAWGWPPLVSVRPYTRREIEKGGRE